MTTVLAGIPRKELDSAQHTWAPTKELCKAQDPLIMATIPRPKLVSKCTQRMLTFI